MLNILMCVCTHTHTHTHTQFLPLFVYSYTKNISFKLLLLCHVLVMWKGSPLVLPFQNLLSSVYFLFQRKFTVCLSNSTGKTLQETSTTAQDRITDKRLDLPSYLQLLPHNPNKTYGTSFTEHQEMKDSNLPDTGNKLSKP